LNPTPLRAHVTPAAPAPLAAPPHPEAPEHQAPGDLGFDLPPPAKITRSRALAIAAVALALIAAAFLLRFLPARQARAALEADTRDQETGTLRVQIIAPTVVSSDHAIALPGSVQPLEEILLYPRVSGYVRRWAKDLGDKVGEGDLLAEIDTPDLDQQIAQARAQLAQAEAGILQAQANARFSTDNLTRYRQLLPAGLASQQDFDKAKSQAEVDQASVGVAQAATGSQRANLQYLGQLKTFARVVAPFPGTITSRTVERGMLLTAGTATPLFKLSALDPVRVFVQVPQDVAPGVRVGAAASVAIREFAGRTFEGTIAHSAGALDATTRTMMTEVRVPNPKGELLTGMYAQVSLTLPSPHQVLAIPATALLNDASGLRVAVVEAREGHDRVRLVTVALERDTGATMEIASGLAPGDRVVKLPTAALTDGREVEVVR
jgi:membrane fusion protein, multidrug efflux system